ncbi:nucleotide-binding protein [Candidatus Woesearchaeota archaeon]|nr:nucleotide-binding protein [Candidatus Woesearchaeota archaeon]
MVETKKIVLDTNFLMIPAQFGLDITEEIDRIANFPYKLLIFDKSLEELSNVVKKQKGADKEAARTTKILVHELVNNNKLNIIPAKTAYIDQEILDFADKDTIVATQDVALRSRLKKRGIKTIIMRQKKHLLIEG